MEKLSFAIMFLISFPEAIVISALGLLLLDFKPTIKQILLIGLFEAILGDFARMLSLPFGIHSLLQVITFTLVIYFVTLIPYRTSVLATLFGFTIYAVVEAVSAPILLALTGIPLEKVLNSTSLRFWFFLPEGLITGLIILLVIKFKLKLPLLNFQRRQGATEDKATWPNDKSFTLIMLFLAQVLFGAVFYLSSYVVVNDPARYKILIANPIVPVFIIVILSIATIIMIKRTLAMIENEVEAKIQIEALRHVEDLLYTIREQRHNFSHELQAVYGLLEVEAFQEAKEYIFSSMSEIAATEELVKTDNLGITALLQIKNGLAQAKKIEIKTEVRTSLNSLPINLREINIMLGNLIDNAIEATGSMPSEDRKIQVNLDEDQENYIFEVINSGRPIGDILIDKIFEPGFSTKMEGMGMGLYSVRKTVQKYRGKIELTSDERGTCFRIYLPRQ